MLISMDFLMRKVKVYHKYERSWGINIFTSMNFHESVIGHLKQMVMRFIYSMNMGSTNGHGGMVITSMNGIKVKPWFVTSVKLPFKSLRASNTLSLCRAYKWSWRNGHHQHEWYQSKTMVCHQCEIAIQVITSE